MYRDKTTLVYCVTCLTGTRVVFRLRCSWLVRATTGLPRLKQTTHRGPWTRRSAEETRSGTVSLNQRSLDVAMPRHTNVLRRLAASRERIVNTDWIAQQAYLTGQLYITLILGSAPRGAQLSRFTVLLASLVA